MKKTIKQKIYLKELSLKDVTKNYVRWMNDYNVVKYTEQRYKKHNKKDVAKFVMEKEDQKKFKLKKLQAGFHKMNLASKLVLEKNNFKREGVLKSQIIFKRKRHAVYLYGLAL